MTHRLGSAGLATFAVLHLVALAAPAVMLAVAADKGGLPYAHGLDLVGASLVIGAASGSIVWRRLRREQQARVMFASVLIAEFDALVVLALLSTGLLIVLLGGLAPEHAAIVNNGWPIVLVWVATQLSAVGLTELIRSAVLRWLEPDVFVGKHVP